MLESFRLWSEYDWMDEAELIDKIKGKFAPTPEMLVGIAVHRCLEKPDRYQDQREGGYRVPVKDDAKDEWKIFRFTDALIDPCLAALDRNGVFEVRGVREYGDVTVVTKADQILGTRIVSNKTKCSSQFDYDKYAESCQWRFELDLFQGASAVHYNVFLLDIDKDTDEVSLRETNSFDFYPYAGLHHDCARLVEKFRQYVHQRRLTEYLQESEYARAQIR